MVLPFEHESGKMVIHCANVIVLAEKPFTHLYIAFLFLRMRHTKQYTDNNILYATQQPGIISEV